MAKLRVLFRTEHTYENMEKEVAGIEKESKNSLCKYLIDIVKPSEIGKLAQERMGKVFGSFDNGLSEEQLFQKVYNDYLAELKYFAKAHQKKGDGK